MSPKLLQSFVKVPKKASNLSNNSRNLEHLTGSDLETTRKTRELRMSNLKFTSNLSGFVSTLFLSNCTLLGAKNYLTKSVCFYVFGYPNNLKVFRGSLPVNHGSVLKNNTRLFVCVLTSFGPE